MKKGKNAVKIVAFLAIFLAIFWQVQEMVTPIWDLPYEGERQRRTVAGFYAEAPNSLEVLWLGTSHMQYGVSPMHIYEKTGIRSYNLGTSVQSMALSYERLKTVFDRQSPQIVVLDASSLFFMEYRNNDGTQWLKAVNEIPWSHFIDRWNAAKAYVNENNLGMDRIMDVIIPMFRFHTNYFQDEKNNDIELEDESSPYYRKGHVIIGKSVAASEYGEGTFEDMLREYTEREQLSEQNLNHFTELEENLANNEKYLIDMKELCDEKKCELILTKLPVHTSYLYSGYWSREKHDIIQRLADQMNIKFIDLNDFDLINWKTDSVDGGAHLNERGAMKASSFLGEWLQNNYEFTTDIDAQLKKAWDSQLQMYNNEVEYTLLQTETDLKEYFSRVKQGNYTLFAAVSETIGCQWGGELEELFRDLTGSSMSMQDKEQWAYVNVSSDGALLDEMEDSLTCIRKGKLPNGKSYSVTSNGFYAGSSASILIDNVEYASTGRGIRFVVYDNELECVVDSVTFDTHSASLKASRNNSSYLDAFNRNIVNRAKLMNEVD